MAYLRRGDIHEATAIFEHGCRQAPWDSRPYFETAAIVSLLRSQRHQDAISRLGACMDGLSGVVRATGQLLLAHAWGQISDTQRAEQWLNEALPVPEAMILSLQVKLAERYQLRLSKSVVPLEKTISELDIEIEETEFLLCAAA
jgi:hypothetical protein